MKILIAWVLLISSAFAQFSAPIERKDGAKRAEEFRERFARTFDRSSRKS